MLIIRFIKKKKNLKQEESRAETHVERQEKRLEEFIDTLEDWFGELNESQKKELKRMHDDWYRFRQDPVTERDQLKKERQQIFLAFLRGNPSQEEAYDWLAHWLRNWSDSNDPEALERRNKRIRRNMQRILQVDALFTSSQRQHAVVKIQDLIEQMKRALQNQ